MECEQALITCAGIIFGIIWDDEHDFGSSYKTSTARIISKFFQMEILLDSWFAWSLRLIIFKFSPLFSLFSILQCLRVGRRRPEGCVQRKCGLCRYAPVLNFTGNKIAVVSCVLLGTRRGNALSKINIYNLDMFCVCFLKSVL